MRNKFINTYGSRHQGLWPLVSQELFLQKHTNKKFSSCSLQVIKKKIDLLNKDQKKSKFTLGHNEKIFFENGLKKYQDSFTTNFSSSTNNMEDKYRQIKVHSVQRDFFDEPVTIFYNSEAAPIIEVGTIMASLDTHAMCVVTRGKSTAGSGGDELGISASSAHAVAITWSSLLQEIEALSKNSVILPMTIVTALSPLLAQTGVAYLQCIDSIIQQQSNSGHERMSLYSMAERALDLLDSKTVTLLSIREKFHLQILQHLIQNDFHAALIVLHRLLEQCPGDAFALSLIMDIAHTLGKKEAPLRAASAVASYYNDRGRRSGVFSQSSLSSHQIGSAYIALGLAVGGKLSLAERTAEQIGAILIDMEGVGGVTAWALAHVFDAEGRVAEGNTQLSTFDGARHYEGCGFLFWDARLALQGAKFTLDREGSNADRSALRRYDENVERILEYCGFTSLNESKGQSQNRNNIKPIILTHKVPRMKRDGLVKAAEGAAKSFFSGGFLFSSESKQKNIKDELMDEYDAYWDLSAQTIEDIMTWLPPTPQLLTDATFLLLRLTISGAIDSSDSRWQHLKIAWEKMLQIQGDDGFTDFPLAKIASSLLLSSSSISNTVNDTRIETLKMSDKFEQISCLLGKLMKLGIPKDGLESVEESLSDESRSEWLKLSKMMMEVRDGKAMEKNSYYERDFEGWDMEFRPFVEYIIFHVACITEDYTALCYARSVCSEGVIFRPNSPEVWWKYSVILDKLGDTIAAEDARSACVSLGSGEGGSGAH